MSSKMIPHVTQQFLHTIKQTLIIQWPYSKFPLPRASIQQGQKDYLLNNTQDLLWQMKADKLTMESQYFSFKFSFLITLWEHLDSYLFEPQD